jgi:hypothetical protein
MSECKFKVEFNIVLSNQMSVDSLPSSIVVTPVSQQSLDVRSPIIQNSTQTDVKHEINLKPEKFKKNTRQIETDKEYKLRKKAYELKKKFSKMKNQPENKTKPTKMKTCKPIKQADQFKMTREPDKKAAKIRKRGDRSDNKLLPLLKLIAEENPSNVNEWSIKHLESLYGKCTNTYRKKKIREFKNALNLPLKNLLDVGKVNKSIRTGKPIAFSLVK